MKPDAALQGPRVVVDGAEQLFGSGHAPCVRFAAQLALNLSIGSLPGGGRYGGSGSRTRAVSPSTGGVAWQEQESTASG
jgi:hypothetical protein